MKKRKLYYGWIVVAGCFALAGATMGMTTNMLSLFVKPVCAELGIERSAYSLAGTILILCQMCTAPIVGKVYTKVKNPVRVMTFACIVVSGAMFGYSSADSLAEIYFFAALMGLSNAYVVDTAISMIIKNWFSKSGGTAVGIAMTGSGCAALIMTPLISGAIELMGWRWGFRIIAVLYFALSVPVLLTVIRSGPGEKEPDLAGGEEKTDVGGSSFSEAMRSPAFWLVTAACFLIGVSCMGTLQHTVPYLSDIGYSASRSSAVYSVIMASLIAGKIIIGRLFDKKGIVFAMTYGVTMMCLSLVLLMFASNFGAALAFGICFGLADSMVAVPAAFIIGEYFGRKDFAPIMGMTQVGQGLGMSLGVVVSGKIYDAMGGYSAAWILYMLLSLTGLILHVAAYRSNQSSNIQLKSD